MTLIDFIGPVALVLGGIPLVLSAAARRPKLKPVSPLKAAVDEHWTSSPSGVPKWDGSTFQRPKRGAK